MRRPLDIAYVGQRHRPVRDVRDIPGLVMKDGRDGVVIEFSH